MYCTISNDSSPRDFFNFSDESPKTRKKYCRCQRKLAVTRDRRTIRNCTVPDSLTREEGFVDRNVKHPCQTVPPGSPELPYMPKVPVFLVLRPHNLK